MNRRGRPRLRLQESKERTILQLGESAMGMPSSPKVVERDHQLPVILNDVDIHVFKEGGGGGRFRGQSFEEDDLELFYVEHRAEQAHLKARSGSRTTEAAEKLLTERKRVEALSWS